MTWSQDDAAAKVQLINVYTNTHTNKNVRLHVLICYY